jgi:hypothetical protein
MTDDVTGQNPTTGMEQDVLAQHRTIQDAARQMESARDLDELLRRLAGFRALLVPHFASEEAPEGYFDVVRSHASCHVGWVDEFGREHRAFLAEIDQLSERARACIAGPVAEILRQAADLTRRLREHEARENDLLIDALYVDIGDED